MVPVKKYIHDVKSVNSRLDGLQEARLRVRLVRLGEETDRRREIASRYLNEIRNSAIRLPAIPEHSLAHVWHLFVGRCDKRQALQAHLSGRRILTLIHYLVPIHRQTAYAELALRSLSLSARMATEVLSFPLYACMSDEYVASVITACNDFSHDGAGGNTCR